MEKSKQRERVFGPGDLVKSAYDFDGYFSGSAVPCVIKKNDVGLILKKVWYDTDMSYHYLVMFNSCSVMYHPNNLKKYRRAKKSQAI